MNVTENSDTKKITQVANRYITAFLKRKKQEEGNNSFEEKIAKKIAAFTGSMMFFYIHLAILSCWFFWNAGWLGLKPFDPSFVILAMFASTEAIFLSTILLISQNRMTAKANKRSGVEPLTEHEVAKLIEFKRDDKKNGNARGISINPG